MKLTPLKKKQLDRNLRIFEHVQMRGADGLAIESAAEAFSCSTRNVQRIMKNPDVLATIELHHRFVKPAMMATLSEQLRTIKDRLTESEFAELRDVSLPLAYDLVKRRRKRKSLRKSTTGK